MGDLVGGDRDLARDFYDAFLESRMLQYRLEGNRRIDIASESVLSLVRTDSRVLELGCGIGLTSERICGEIETGHLWACDISPRNIWYARRTVRAPKSRSTFFVADFVNDFAAVTERLRTVVDVVVMVDVLEHVPVQSRRQVLSSLSRVASPDALLFLSFPSPGYQQKLRLEKPGELQPVDETISLEALADDARASGWEIRSWSLIDVWLRNQYVHTVLCRDVGVRDWHENGISASRSPTGVVRRALAAVRRRYRYWRYVTRVFGRPDTAGLGTTSDDCG